MVLLLGATFPVCRANVDPVGVIVSVNDGYRLEPANNPSKHDR